MSRANPRYHRTNASGPPVLGTATVATYKLYGKLELQMTVTGLSYYSVSGPPTTLQLGTLMTNISNTMLPLIKACVSADWTVDYERIDVVSNNTTNGQIMTTHAGQTGGRPAGHLPTQMAAVIIKNTNLKGQHGRGRVSLPGIATADVTASTITAAAEITALNAFIAQFVTVMSDGANNWNMCVPQRLAASPRLVANYSLVNGGTLKTLLGTVRKRKIGRGK